MFSTQHYRVYNGSISKPENRSGSCLTFCSEWHLWQTVWVRKISQLKGLSVLHGAGKNTSSLALSFTESGSVVFLCEEYLHWEESGNGVETHGDDLERICEWVLPSQAIRKGGRHSSVAPPPFTSTSSLCFNDFCNLKQQSVSFNCVLSNWREMWPGGLEWEECQNLCQSHHGTEHFQHHRIRTRLFYSYRPFSSPCSP